MCLLLGAVPLTCSASEQMLVVVVMTLTDDTGLPFSLERCVSVLARTSLTAALSLLALLSCVFLSLFFYTHLGGRVQFGDWGPSGGFAREGPVCAGLLNAPSGCRVAGTPIFTAQPQRCLSRTSVVAWALMLVSYMHEMLRNNHLLRVRLGIVKKTLGMLTDAYLLTLILCISRGHEIQFYEKLRCCFCTV